MENYIIILLLVVLIGLVIFLSRKNNGNINQEIDRTSIDTLNEIKTSITSLGEGFADTRKEIAKDLTSSLTAVDTKIGNFNTHVKTLTDGQKEFSKILSGVKKFGTLAEFSLGALIEDLLPSSQYIKNYKPNEDTDDIVEFGIILQDDVISCVDSYWPLEKIKAIDEAHKLNDKNLLLEVRKKLASATRTKASKISEKYIAPPKTTDFAILYAPTEGLYSELVSYRDSKTKTLLSQELMKDYKITIMGPNTLSAYLQALHMGFQTLKVQKHATEVHDALKTLTHRFDLHFGKIVDLRKILEDALKSTDEFGTDARSIKRTLESLKEPVEISKDNNVKKIEIKKTKTN